MKKTIVFTTDCECFKKGDEITISTNTANLMVNVEKVAKFKEVKEPKQTK
jgi:hypothetical protein